MIRIVLQEILLKLAISLYAVDQGFIATLQSQQRIHGSTTNRSAEVTARDHAQELAGALYVKSQRFLLPFSQKLNHVAVDA
jgi:hypothetical protein